MIGGEPAVSRGGDLLLALMGAGREPQRARPICRRSRRNCARIDRQCGSGGFQIADGGDVARAEPAQTLGLLGVLRQALRKGAEHRADQPGPPAPAPIRARRQPAIDQHHRDAASVRREHQVGPQLGFDPERQIGPPMIEKALDPARADRPARTDGAPAPAAGLLQKPGRGDGAGGDQDFELGPRLQQPLDQPQHRGRLADARGMDPHQRPRRPRASRLSPRRSRSRAPSSLPRRRRRRR